MPEINHRELKSYLSKPGDYQDEEKTAHVFLIHGDELLYKTALDEIINALVSDSGRSLNYEMIDGTNDNVGEVLRRINTYSLLSGGKILGFCDSQVFYSKINEGELLEKVRNAHDNDELLKAAKQFANLLGIMGLTLEDVNRDNRVKALKLDSSGIKDGEWLDRVIGYCGESGITAGTGSLGQKAFQEAIEKGFPEDNRLVITTDIVDKRRSLYKVILEKGIVVDCSVPKGSGKADEAARESILNEKMHEILSRYKKTMDKDAYLLMYEMTGFDLRGFTSSLEKLVTYTGDRNKITRKDVKDVVLRTRKDPLYEFTNAVSDRDLGNALFYLESLFSGGDIEHPLQLLAAMVNQIRKLLLMKDFAESPNGKLWRPGSPYNYFQKSVLPAIREYDQDILNKEEAWNALVSENTGSGEGAGKPAKGKSGRKKKKSGGDIALSGNHPYPVYQTLRKSDKFTKDELVEAMVSLANADKILKSSPPGGHRLVLEKTIFHICGDKGRES